MLFQVIQQSSNMDFNLYCVKKIFGFIYWYYKILYIK